MTDEIDTPWCPCQEERFEAGLIQYMETLHCTDCGENVRQGALAYEVDGWAWISCDG